MITITTKTGYKVDIVRNMVDSIPRDWCEYSYKIICINYPRFGDRHSYKSFEELIDGLIDRCADCDEIYEDTDSMTYEEKMEYLEDFYAMVPLHDFSSQDGINIPDNMKPIGLVYMKIPTDTENLIFGEKRRKFISKMQEVLKEEFTNYKHYLNNDCYSYAIRDKDGIVQAERTFYGKIEEILDIFNEDLQDNRGVVDLCEVVNEFSMDDDDDE